MCVKETGNKDVLLYSTGSYSHCSVVTFIGVLGVLSAKILNYMLHT